MKLFKAKEEKNLISLLTRTSDESGIYLEELHGLLFGLAITPEVIPAEEWVPLIFGGEPAFDNDPEAETCLESLIAVYERMLNDGRKGKLTFPFNYDAITNDELMLIDGWTYGLFMALSLRPALWGMGREYSIKEIEELPGDVIEVMDAYSVIISIAVPEEMEEGFKEVMDTESLNRDEMMDMFYEQLPFAVEILQEHGLKIREANSTGKRPSAPRKTIRKEKTGPNDPCPCGSGKKYKKCCGAN